GGNTGAGHSAAPSAAIRPDTSGSGCCRRPRAWHDAGGFRALVRYCAGVSPRGGADPGFSGGATMSSKRGAWISRRGQADAEHAIDQVIDRQVLPGEQVQHLPDEQIEDSPYQARQPFSDASVEELAQGLRETGFQSVLIVRLHGDLAKRRRGLVQLVYGHRRRAAWRLICAERSQPCLLPVVVREMSDAQILTIGAQENLQRQDLDPLEEAQIVAWHEQVFFDKNQAQLGAMLGKSSDWVSVRSRIHKLPDGLKERLRDRPRAIAQMLELGSLYTQQPEVALTLADRVVQEN